MHISIRYLRSHTKSVLDAVGRGEEVYITNREQVQAKIVPITGEITEESDAFGLWQNNPKVQDVDAFVRKVRKPRHDLG